MSSSVLSSIPIVELDDSGTFKYVLIRAHLKGAKDVYFVRGTKKCSFHKDIADPFCDMLSSKGIQTEVLGGGWVDVNTHMRIYGTSVFFGPADHKLTKSIVEKHYKGQITVICDD